MKNIFFYETPIGKVGIAEDGDAITDLFFDGDFEGKIFIKDAEIKQTDLLYKAGEQLKAYFQGKQKKFNLPLAPNGTEFQKSVWNALIHIPYGETKSYKEIAEMIGNPKACRAVGLANNKNPIAIFIPCHRVIGSNGKLVGYAGGIKLKEYLLDLEKK